MKIKNNNGPKTIALLLPFLWTEITLATLSNDENLPVKKLKLIRDINGSDCEFPNCFKI